MDKTFRILQLLTLLVNRSHVTLDMIKKVCNIPRRTAFRYLRTISEVSIPVFFDKETRTYRLLDKSSVPLAGEFSIGDVTTIVVALKLLRRCTNQDYQDDIEKLITKTLVRQSVAVEEVVSTTDQYLDTQDCSMEISDFVSSVLIQAAISCGRGVRLTTGSELSQVTSVDIDCPSLQFRKIWQLVDNHILERGNESMDGIRKVSIL